jgi:hypothetical protein
MKPAIWDAVASPRMIVSIAEEASCSLSRSPRTTFEIASIMAVS